MRLNFFCAFIVSIAIFVPFAACAQDKARPEAVERLLSESLVEPMVRLMPADMRVRELKGRFPLKEAQRVDRALMDFIVRHRDAFGLSEPGAELLVSRVETAEGASRVVFQQLYKGIPIWGRKLVMDVNADGELVVAVSRVGRVKDIRTGPAVSGEEAVRTVEAEWVKSRKGDLPPCARELVIYRGALAYNVKVPEDEAVYNFFVDALDGRLVNVEKAEKEKSGACH